MHSSVPKMTESALPFDVNSIPESHRRALLRELRTGEMMERVKAEARQKVIAKDNQRDHRSIPGVGRLVARFVRSVGTKIQTGYGTKQFEDKPRPSCRRVKFHKSYG